MKIYRVGGCVRDQFLNHQPNDIDYCMEAESYEIMLQYLKDHNFQIIRENPKYLTIKVKCSDIKVDFALCRKDGIYSDHRRPDSVEIGTIYDDLARRDFTINAMAIDEETGELIDPYSGKDDLENCVIRCVGSVKERLFEDPLRIIRALRFSITKECVIHDDIREIIWDNPETITLLKEIPLNRIQDEFFKMFSYNTITTMALLSSLPEDIQKILFEKIWLKPTLRRN